jgi:hypothetical protein
MLRKDLSRKYGKKPQLRPGCGRIMICDRAAVNSSFALLTILPYTACIQVFDQRLIRLVHATFMQSSEIRVVVTRPLKTVFSVYTQPDTWRWCSFIRDIRWVGPPWEDASRLQIEIDGAARTVDQVLEPSRRVDFLSHFGGITLETKVTFQVLSDFETEIRVQLEFVGVFSRVAGFAIESAIAQSTRQFFQDLKQACERMPSA